VVRRRLTIKRLDPWSVLKFGFVANVVLLVMFLLAALVVWFIIDRLAIVDQICAIALDVGFTECGVNFSNLFRALLLLGLLWVVVQTAVLVFLSFLHNLLADLTGGLTITVNDHTPLGAAREEPAGRPATVMGTAATGPAAPASASRTGRPPVPPLRRDPGATGQTAPSPRPAPDPHGPGSRGSADADEAMFCDRRERGPR
jgi:hypothetical protein